MVKCILVFLCLALPLIGASQELDTSKVYITVGKEKEIRQQLEERERFQKRNKKLLRTVDSLMAVINRQDILLDSLQGENINIRISRLEKSSAYWEGKYNKLEKDYAVIKHMQVSYLRLYEKERATTRKLRKKWKLKDEYYKVERLALLKIILFVGVWSLVIDAIN